MTSPTTTRKAIASPPRLAGRCAAAQRFTSQLFARCFHALLLSLVGLLLASGGCASCRLPAIDPSGDRLFLPTSQSSTNLETCLPKPAFAAPPKPTPVTAAELGSAAPVTYAPGIACAANSTGSTANQPCATENQSGPPPAIPAAPPPSKAKCNGPARPTPG
ncbi:MAG: hypothetical protein ACKOU6_20420, partial [Planctomycetota bacterium]